MPSPYDNVIDGFTMIGLFGFPPYWVYWIGYHLRRERRRRLWLGMPALLAWCAATYFCFLRLMIGCMGGGCADKVSPFLEYAIIYAFSSIVLILMLRALRARP